MTLLHRLASWLGLPAQGRRERVAVVEECEQRILYSADLNPALWAGGDDAATSSAIVRPVDEQALAASVESTATAQAQQERRRHEIVFVDAAVPDAQKVIDGLLASRPAGTQVEVVMLQASSDGLSQIGDVLVHERDIDALHIISHGAGGFLRLGNATIGLDALQARDAELRGWREALSTDADLLLYGCDVGAGDDGAAFVARLASATGADVGASTDDTGSAARGGDWVLERASGPIESGPVAFADSNPFAQWDGLLAAFVVSNTNDSGVGSLRQAIIDANALAGADTISFSIGGGGAQTISLTSALPQIAGQVTLDGWTQGGFVGTPLVRVDGTLAGASADGIYFADGSDNSIVRGLVITKFARDGIFVASGADGVTIAGNWIGTSGTGSTGVGNGDDGVDIAGSSAIIGGTGANDRNVITNNADEGINIAGSGVTGHLIQGNYIGVDPDGATGGGNNDVGIAIISGTGNSIGGTIAAARNVISKNYEGIEINTSNNVVQGNYIGTDAGGTLNRGNRNTGGVEINTGSDNLIGGAAAGAGNLIAFNAWDGVRIYSTAGNGNAVLGNSIHSNVEQGIDLQFNGVTANDANDADTGANNLQNFPLLTSAQMVSTTQLQVVGTFNSTANSFFRIEFFSSTAQDATGYGEGQTYLGFVNVTTDGSGNASFNTTLTAAVTTGSYVSATATKSNAAFTAFTDTSEFALNVVATNTAPVLDASKSPALTAINEDTGAPSGAVGTLVSSLVDFASPSGQVDNVADADAGALLGIAVTGADTANGLWWYSTNNGSSWNALGAVSGANARLLAADANTRLYFQPNANYSGALANAITFRAWDQTAGTAGSTTNAVVNLTVLDQFGSVSYSNNNGTANWSSAWVETDSNGGGASGGRILISGGQLDIRADSVADSIYRVVNLSGAASATLSFNYTNSLGSGDTIVVQVSSNGGSSYSTLAGGTFSPSANTGSGTFSADITSAIASNTRIRFYVSTQSANNHLYVDNVQIAYSTPDVGGTTGLSTATDTVSLVVNPVADTPSATNASTNEDTQSTTGLVISRHVADGTEVTNFKITGITNGTLYKNDGTTQITNGTFITIAEGNAGLKFTPAANFNGSGSLTIQASTSNVDAGLGGSTAVATITVNAVNDAPTLGNGTLAAVAEDTASPAGQTVATTFSGQFADIDAGSSFSGIAVVGNTANAGTQGAWQYSSNAGSNWFAIGTVADGATALAVSSSTLIRFVPVADYNGTPPALTVRGLDNSYVAGFSSTAGSETRVTVNTTSNGGSTAIAAATATLSTTITAVNDAPTGAPLVTGTPTEDQVLSVNTASIADADGLGAFSYQWQRNGVNIGGAASSTYTLGDADVGTNIRVVVSYVDTKGTAESLTSAAVGPVANVNDAPTGAPVVTGTPTEDQILTANTATIADADGLGAFSYQWQRNSVNIGGATASTYTLGDADVGTNIRVVVSYTDGNGTAETLTSAAVGPVANINDAPTGAPVVTGAPTEDQILTANTGTVADADGLGAFSYQWQRNGVNIASATASTYTLGNTDVGTNIRVIVSYTDAKGTAESLTSAAVGPIANANDAPTLTFGEGNKAFTEGALAVMIDTVPFVSDLDSANFDTGTLTITVSANASVEDRVELLNTGMGAGQVGVSGANVYYGGTLIGTQAGGIGAMPFVVSFNTNADANIVGEVMANIRFWVAGDAPSTAARTVEAVLTDGDGGTSITASKQISVTAVNDAPTGAPVVTGTPTEDQILTASIVAIADADGLGAFSYQWQRNGANIVGATASTYTLGDADVGNNIRVVVSYTDGGGTAESLTSAAVGPVANVNDAPTGAPVVNGTPTEDQVLTVNTGTIGDADGLGAFSYQWQRNGANIVGATAANYTLGDADVGNNIRIVVSYTDARGTAESLTSAAVGPIANVNDAPTGAPVVTGTPTEDQVLTANTATIADADGLGAFSYQWQRNGANIGGATASTYTAGDVDVGTNIRVIVSHTDARGTAESLTSAAVGPVANINDVPTGAPVVTGTPTEDQVLTVATGTIADADGLSAFSYQWQRNGANIGGATASTYTLGDADVGANIRVVVSYTDGNGTAESLTSAAIGPIANVNDGPGGAPVVIGTTTEDQVLTADTGSIADADGLGVFSYQWQRNGLDVAGATASTYTLRDTDVGTNIRVVVAYTDGNGTAESLTSAAAGPVANVNDAPSGTPVVTGAAIEDQTLTVDPTAIADADGLGSFSYQWQRTGVNIVGATGSTYTLGDADVGANIRVNVSYADGNGTAESLTSAAVGPVANVNDAPSGVPVVAGTTTEDQTLTANISAVADADGLGAISYQWQRNGTNIVGATGGTFTLGDADVGANIRVVVSYIDGNGTAESLTSAAVGPIANVNDPPVGAPVVTGTATEDQVLTADISTIADADGLGALSYQWQRNGANVVGANGGTYTLGDADVGTNIRVVVSYIDGHGTSESLTSAAVGPVANINDAPSGAVVVTGTTTEDQVLTADTSAIADADGLGPFSYQWQRNGANILGATAASYVLGDIDVGANIRVIVAYTDGNGSAEGLISAAVGPVANLNDAPVISSNGGAATASLTGNENQAAVTTVTSIDSDGGAPAYSIVGGADAARFTIDSASGALRFAAAPDFEAPLDADADNVYDLTVQVWDGLASDTQALSITIAGVNEAPTGITPATAAIEESVAAGVLVATVRAVDADAGDLFSFSLVSDEAGRFAIDAANGRIVVAPGAVLDFETQASIDLVVRVTDAAGLSADRSFTVALRDIAEGAGPVAPPMPPTTPPDEIVTPAPTPTAPARDHGASAAAPAPAPALRGAGATLPAELEGERLRASADAAPGDTDLRTARPDAQPWGHLREREGVDTLVVTVDLNGFDDGGGPSAPISAALRQISVALRNASIEAQTADSGAIDERRTPSTWLAIAQDPVRVASLGFTAGFVWWLTRSGGLLTSMLMGVPAWRHLDLLPVVARRRNDDDDDDLALDSALDSRTEDDPEDSALLDLFEAQATPHQARSSL